jgi:DNA-binding NarL/FixJ family response regulator
MRVVVADDALVTREGIARLLDEAGIEIVGLAADADELLRKVLSTRPDVALVDIRMPPTNTDEGLRAAQHIRERYPDTAVLVLSSYLESEFAARLLEDRPAGAGYLLKDRIRHVTVLLDALERVARRETVVDPAIVARLMQRRRRADPLDELTPREREILGMIAEGYSNAGIARRLVVTERTVESHVRQVLLKLGIRDDHDINRRVLAVIAWLRSG